MIECLLLKSEQRVQVQKPQIQLRRQEIPQQQILTGPALMEDIERINTVMMCPTQRVEFALHNPYTMNMDRRNKNCYSYREFGHLVRNYQNREMENRIREKRRLGYEQRLRIKGNNGQDNLNKKGDLVIFNQVLVTIGLQYFLEQQKIYLYATQIMETC